MSAWSRAYVSVQGPGRPVETWDPPSPLPCPAGAAVAPDLRPEVDPALVGLTGVDRIIVRWRAPGAANPRKRTFRGADIGAGVALACDIARAWAAGGVGWSVDAAGRPVPVADVTGAAATADPGDTASGPPPAATVPPAPAIVTMAPRVPAPRPERAGSGLAWAATLSQGTVGQVGPDNLLLRAMADGGTGPGATVAEVVDLLVRERWDSWSPAHRANMASVLGLVRHLMVYREPWDDDPPVIAAWKLARLAVPGVEEGQSQHVALLLPPDLSDAVQLRRRTDLRVARLNAQALERHDRAWHRYLAARTAAQGGTRRGGRMPQRPPDEVALRPTPDKVSARTEELFATALGAVLGTAERAGLLRGPNPWRAFAPAGRPSVAYRRPVPMAIHERVVLPMGLLVDLADEVARRGPLDRRHGRPVGHRFRALILASCAGARPSEYAGLRSDDYRAGPQLSFARSGGPTSPSATDDGSGYHTTDRLKGRGPGDTRDVGLPRYVADALDEHISCGYPQDGRLFTSPEGGPLRWANLADRYWRPAVERVCGRSAEPLLRQLEVRWLRKGAITWLLRSGMSLVDVADLTGHSPHILLDHYAGVVNRTRRDHRLWTSWDDAWNWAVQERHLPGDTRPEALSP